MVTRGLLRHTRKWAQPVVMWETSKEWYTACMNSEVKYYHLWTNAKQLVYICNLQKLTSYHSFRSFANLL